MEAITTAEQRLVKVIKTNSLNLYLNDKYLEAHRHMIVEVLKLLYNRSRINMKLDEETISHMFTVKTRELNSILVDWMQLPAFKAIHDVDDEYTPFINVHFVLRKESAEPRTLRYTVILEQDGTVLKDRFCGQEVEMEQMCHFIETYKEIWHKLNSEMDHFIETAQLKEYYDEDYLFTRRNEILVCVKDSVINHGLLIQIESKSSYIFQQLFTNEKVKPDALFHAILSNPRLDAKRVDVSFQKRTMTLRCQEMSYNASLLKDLLNSQNQILSNPEEYREILNEHEDTPVDVYSLIFNDRCKSITILRKVSQLKIMKLLTAEQMVASNLLHLENREKIRSFCREKEIDAFCKERIETILYSIAKRGVKLEENLQRFLTDRVIDMSNKLYSVTLACDIMADCLTRLIQNSKIDEKDMHRLSVTTKMIKLNEINENIFPSHMRNEETALIISDHKQLNIPITLLNCNLGNNLLSQDIVPCILNNKDERQDTAITKKKRKGSPSNEQPVNKKICLVAKRSEDDKDSYDAENDILTVVVETKRVATADYDQVKACPVCKKTRSLKSFCQQVKRESNYMYERNVCNTCRIKYVYK